MFCPLAVWLVGCVHEEIVVLQSHGDALQGWIGKVVDEKMGRLLSTFDVSDHGLIYAVMSSERDTVRGRRTRASSRLPELTKHCSSGSPSQELAMSHKTRFSCHAR